MSTVERIKKLAREQGRSMTYLCRALGFSSRTYFNDIEKNGRTIPEDKLAIIADILGVSVEYLACKTDSPEKASAKILDTSGILPSPVELTQHEATVIDAYRAQPELQGAVDKLLGVEGDDYIVLYTAAHSIDNEPDKVVLKSKPDWNKIKSAPETDETLL